MRRFAIITLIAGLTTFSLFVFMAFLINNDQVVIDTPLDPIQVVVMTLPDETPAEIKPPVVLTPPVTPKPIPSTTVSTVTDSGPGPMDYHLPGITQTGSQIPNLTLGQDTNAEARPVVRVSPKYPMIAARDGIEGWVMLAFNINAIGEVVDVSVIDSKPKRVFDKAARQALKKWKYKAKIVDGVAVAQQNLTVQLDFSMAQS